MDFPFSLIVTISFVNLCHPLVVGAVHPLLPEEDQQNSNNKTAKGHPDDEGEPGFHSCPVLSVQDPEFVARKWFVKVEDFPQPSCDPVAPFPFTHVDAKFLSAPRVWYSQAGDLPHFLTLAHLFSNIGVLSKEDLEQQFNPKVPYLAAHLPSISTAGTTAFIFRGEKVFYQNCAPIRGKKASRGKRHANFLFRCIPAAAHYSSDMDERRMEGVDVRVLMTDNRSYILWVWCVNGKNLQYLLDSTGPTITHDIIWKVRKKLKSLKINLKSFRLTNRSSCESSSHTPCGCDRGGTCGEDEEHVEEEEVNNDDWNDE